MSQKYKVHLLCNGRTLQTYSNYDAAVYEMDELKYEDTCTGIDDNIYSLNVEGRKIVEHSELDREYYEDLGCTYSEDYFDYEYACMLDKWDNVVLIFNKST